MVEAIGGWYWFVDELEAAGLDARLVNPLEAKKGMPGNKKTDPRDAGSASANAKIIQNGSWSNGVTFTVSTPHIIGISPTSEAPEPRSRLPVPDLAPPKAPGPSRSAA